MLPNLFGFSGCDKACLVIIKDDSCLCLSGLLSTANRANAICILVTCGDGFGFSVVTTGISTGLLLFTVFGASSVCNYLPIAVVVAEFTNGFNLFIIAVFASDGLGTRFGASCSLGDRLYIFMFASIIAACCCGEGDFKIIESSLSSVSIYKLKGRRIDVCDGNNVRIRRGCVPLSCQTVYENCCIVIGCSGNNYFLNKLIVFGCDIQLVLGVESVVVGVGRVNTGRSTIFINGYNEVFCVPNNAFAIRSKCAGSSSNV